MLSLTLANRRTSVLLAIALTVGASGAFAAGVDYVGFAWETGGLAASQPGDILSAATVVTQIDPLFAVDLGSLEGTLYIDGLVSNGGSVDPMSGATTITYAGGTVAIYAGPARNHDWGVNPANATVPSTFVDGDLILSGDFTGFTLTLLPSGLGVFEGYIDATGGSAVAGPCQNCAYTFAGTFTGPTGAQIPEGYDLQIDGVLEVEAAVPNENVSWGSFKQLFNSGR